MSFIAFTSILFYSCNKDELDYKSPGINSYDIKTMFYPTFTYPNTIKVKVIHNKKNKIVQRVGDLIPTSMMYKFYEYIGDTVMYYKDSIIIEKQLLSHKDFTNMNSYRRILFLNNGLIVKEISKLDFYTQDHQTVTTTYHYNDKKQIDQTVKLRSSTKEYSRYKYNDNGNLERITSETFLQDYNGNLQKELCDTTWFEDYDNSPNLTRDLIIFQECYYRALSTNNFRKYVYKGYRISDSLLISSNERNWRFEYDENNNLIY